MCHRIHAFALLRLYTSMKIIFAFLSIAYIAAIFLWADSPMVSRISPYNPYSLLHIPLYGILAILLTFSLVEIRLTPGLNRSRLFVAGGIASVVAMADEYHQSFIPSRDASIIDLFLDFVGIVFALFIVYHRYKKWENTGVRIQDSVVHRTK